MPGGQGCSSPSSFGTDDGFSQDLQRHRGGYHDGYGDCYYGMKPAHQSASDGWL